MISVEEAHDRLIRPLSPLSPQILPLERAVRRVLREPVTARRTQPATAISAMDGYAVRAADLGDAPARLRVVGAVAAGEAPVRALKPGEAMRIFTGASLPEGADTVVAQEDTERGGEQVSVSVTLAPGRHVRPAGLDFAHGDTLLDAPRILTPAHLALIAAGGVPMVSVSPRPKVVVIATGSELVRPGDEHDGPYRTVASSLYGLMGALETWGADPVDGGLVPDDLDQTVAALAGAGDADLLITLGGASVGEHDLVREAIAKAGGSLDFWRIAMRPGKPLMVGTVGQTPFIGLPGNPVSALVCAELFVRAAVDRLRGLSGDLPALQDAVAGTALAQNGPRQDYMRASLVLGPDGLRRAVPVAVQDSSMLRTFAGADALLVRPPHAPALSEGAPCRVLPLGR